MPSLAAFRLARLLAVVCAALAALALTAAGAQGQEPPPPGPPPGGGGDLPVPPGTAPAYVPPGTPGSVPAGPAGPGLAGSGDVALNRKARTVTLALACQANGSVRISVAAVTRGPIARTGYRCSGNRAAPQLRVTPKVAKRLAKLGTTAATATVTQGGKTARLSLTLRAGTQPAPAGFWTDGHLQCTDGTGAPNAYLVEPDFTTATPTPVSTRGWLAWFTPAGGWHWLGIGGENAGRWDTWSANVTGITQFHPDGAATPTPYTWGPVSVPLGQGIRLAGIYEIVYWVGGRPEHHWQYVNAGATGAAAAGGGTPACAY